MVLLDSGGAVTTRFKGIIEELKKVTSSNSGELLELWRNFGTLEELWNFGGTLELWRNFGTLENF